MTEVFPHEFKHAVESQRGGTATLVQPLSVREEFEGKTDWESVMHVFDLSDKAKSTCAYARPSPNTGNTKRRRSAALHLGGIGGPEDAVGAANEAEAGSKNE